MAIWFLRAPNIDRVVMVMLDIGWVTMVLECDQITLTFLDSNQVTLIMLGVDWVTLLALGIDGVPESVHKMAVRVLRNYIGRVLLEEITAMNWLVNLM